MSGKYVGRSAVIIANDSWHDFAIGAEVIIARVLDEGEDTEHWYAEADGQGWYLDEHEFELQEENV